VREFPAPDKPGILLEGPSGTGKTHLAVGALKTLIEKGHSGLFVDFQQLLSRIRSSYSGEGSRDAFESALDAEILLLDDLGAHRAKEYVEDITTEIINHRYNQRKPLIATTNLRTGRLVQSAGPAGTPVHASPLAEVIGERAHSRLFEMCRIVTLDAEDYRVRR